ncbi:MAG: hypothetical protein INF75_05360 [Roseomonas sp.]|nr:hypothetical protein [Roseomonas sp.]MCA3328010.1 hypothetical protein [Roseomonas sp.]MCA3332897.1 hypothetical protein [Roseomonas sp.]MCA3335028.1 hypothetical protein [Roseomonas sp.]MCA3347374.1 hypothetical protein [Roseomonas sp.]
MSKTDATKKTNATKSDLQLVLEQILQHWAAHQHTSMVGRPRSAFAKKFNMNLKTFTRWLNGEHVPQGDRWASFIHELRTVEKKAVEKKANAQGGTTGQKELLFDESWVEKAESARVSAAEAERPKKQPRSQTAPGASSAGQQPPAPAPAPPAGTAPAPAPSAPAPSALRFRVERREPVTPNPDQWFQLILHDAPQDVPNQLCFSIDYTSQTISLSREGGAPLRFEVSLPKVRIRPGWGAVSALKNSINVSNANPTVTYAGGWEVTLPQKANAWALDHFEAALLEAGAPGDKLLISAYARREDIAVTRIGGRPVNSNRDAVIAQALLMLGFEGEGDHAELATGAIVAEQDDKT